jgi:O-antigen/teichoic acid export membrane protein
MRPAQADGVLGVLRLAPVRAGGVFFASRVTNGVLALVQVVLVTHAVGPSQAGRFFLLWTGAWLLSVVAKFGVDGIVPRAVAEARVAGVARVSIRRVIRAGLVCGALLLPPTAVLLDIPLSWPEIGLLSGLAIVWAAHGILAALLKANGQAGLSGVVGNVLWPLGPSLAPVGVIAWGGDWLTIAELSLLVSAGCLAVSLALTVWTLGSAPVAGLVGGRGLIVPVERDELGAALLTTLYEVVVWLPVLLGSLLGVSPEQAAGLFAATRVAGLFSWGYQAVITVLVPRIAQAMAAGEPAAIRRVLWQGSMAGLAVSLPVCVAGALLAEPLLGLLDARYETWAGVLALLILARAVDAATGPLGEALLVGRRTWLDVGFVIAGVVLAVVTAELLFGPVGDLAIGIGAAAGFVAINLMRVGYVALMLRDSEPHPGPGLDLPPLVLPAAVLSLSLTFAVICVAWPPGGAAGALAAAVNALVGAGALATLGAARFGWRQVLASPISIAAVVLIGVFCLRPASLVADPASATAELLALEFGWQDLTSAAGMGTLGLLLFGIAFLVAWRRPAAEAPAAEAPPGERRIVRAALAALAVGTVLWGALFQRNGGFAALEEDPASLHLEQFSGGYGVFGYMLCLGATLLVLWALLGRPSRAVGVTLAASAGVSLAAAIALQTRGPLLATIVAALALVTARGRIGIRRVVAMSLVAVLLLVGFAYMRTVREYAERESLATAIELGLRTEPLTVATGDFTEVENLVLLERLVPESLPWLDGRSLRDVPAAFVPRQLWEGKPLPIDFELSRVTAGPQSRAGTPFTLPGELFWNFGVTGIVIGMTLLGLVAGVGWRVLRGRHGPVASIAAAVLVGYSYLLLTRPLGPMLLTLTMALAALAVVAALGGLISVPALNQRPRRVGPEPGS